MPYLTQAEDIRCAIASCTQASILWLDTEVADYKTDTPQLSLIQVLADGNDLTAESVWILDVLYQPELADEFIAKVMYNPAIEKVFHNASYDRKFLGKRKAKNITCTLELAKTIPYYRLPVPNYQLKTLTEYFGISPQVDKTEQTGDWRKRPLSPRQLDYAAKDVVYVAHVHRHLLDLAQPDPATEDIEALILRYRQIEHRWKQLDTEIQQIKERLKAAMQAQSVKKVHGFRLSSQNRTSKKVAFHQLAEVTKKLGIELDISVQLTKSLQQKLGEVMEELPVEEENKTTWRLSITEPEEEDLPF